ncbi:protease modulator HflC [Thioalbus denitrificans]|uniref:Protein HflC n=1 Tax=Thioalbus denitrificans TaxID=547122 RepID=A0A369BWT6_9GAMM|nr:protease modulator HflC [Thioalbus denitrificans]RCX26140.1 protease FtsH subunit HflC [Thioalbus denitrificans]
MGQNSVKLGVIGLLALLVLGAFSIYTVDERQKAILFRLGEIVRTDLEPGIHFKFPLIYNVGKFDGRILTLDEAPERFLTSEKKNVMVDSFVKWRIDDVGRFYQRTGGDERTAAMRLSQILKDGLRSEFAKRTVQEVVSGDRAQIMDILTENANRQVSELGISVVDVRIQQIELPAEVSGSVYRRMEAERARVARDFRSRGAEAAERIRADADRQRTVILAEAYRDAEVIRGEGDARATDIYAKAYTRDPEFYAFYRSLRAYRDTFRDRSDVILMQPDSEFFRYFKNPEQGVAR